MNNLRANTLKDYSGFILHFGLISAVSAGAFFALGFPPVLSAVALGASAAVHLKYRPYMNGLFQKVLNEEKSSQQSRNASDHSVKNEGPEHKIGSWVNRYANMLGLGNRSELLIVPSDKNYTPADNSEAAKNWFRRKILKEFEKRASAGAFSFSHEQDSVVLTDKVAQTLNDRELKGVVGHEVGRLASNHAQFREIIGMVSTPAKMLTRLNMLITAFSSFKNVGLVVLAGGITFLATHSYARFAKLDMNNPSDKRKTETFEKYFMQASLATMAVTFTAPDLLLAQAISFATRQSIDLLEKSDSRRNEFQADRLAAQITGDPVGVCKGLQKIKRMNLTPENEFDFARTRQETREKGVLTSLFDSMADLDRTHPDIERRCDRIMGLYSSAWTLAPQRR